MGFGSYVAAAAEISVTDGNKVKVHRIVAATDPGYCGQPGADRAADRRLVRLWLVGAVLQRMHGQGRPHRADELRQLQLDADREMPKVESIIMPCGGFWGGVGEPTICVAAPAVLNAFFAATGKRIRSFPLRDQNITFA